MRRVPREGPGACLGVEIGEEPLLGVGAIGSGRDLGRLVGRHALDDVADPLPRHQRERVDEDESRDPVTGQLGGLADDHAAGARPHEDDLGQVLVEQELRDLLRVRGHGDAGPYQMLALRAAVERRRGHPMTGGPQAFDHRLPDPASLIRAVNQHIRRHAQDSLM